jgi:hypothetical protein
MTDARIVTLVEVPKETPDKGTTYDTTGADLLVAQKDFIYSVLLNGKLYERALDALELLENVWRANRYQYKLRDIAYRIGLELFEEKSATSPNAKRKREKLDALIVRADAIHNRNHAR